MIAQHEWICAHDISAKSILNQLLVQLWAEVQEASSGRMNVSLHPNGSLGGPDDMVDQMVNGRIQVHPVSGMILSRITPVVALEGLPFAYPTSDQACQAMAGSTGDAVRSALRAKGIHSLRSVLPQGLNQIFCRGRQIHTVDDLKGFRIRIGNSPYLKDLYGSLGCDPQPVDLQYINEAIREGRADGMEMTYNGVATGQRDEMIESIAISNIRFACFWMCFNAEAWDSLDEELQMLIESRFDVLAKQYVLDVNAANQEGLQTLQDRGLTLTTIDTESFRLRLKDAGFFDRWRVQIGEEVWQSIEAYHEN